MNSIIITEQVLTIDYQPLKDAPPEARPYHNDQGRPFFIVSHFGASRHALTIYCSDIDLEAVKS